MTTVIILAYEDRGYLDECIKSVIAENPKEVILAIDRNEELIKKADQYNLKYTLSKLKGVAASFNLALSMASGKLVKYVCDDDMLNKGAIRAAERISPPFGFIHGNSIQLSQATQETTIYKPRLLNPTFNDLRDFNYIHGGTTFYKREALIKVGGMDVTLKAGEEYEMHLKLLKAGYNCGYIDYEVCTYRLHDAQKSNRKNKNLRMPIINKIKARYAK